MKFDASKIKKILFISLSNIGDVILTFPVMDILKRDFAAASLSVVVGPKAEALFRGNPYIDKVYVFNKHQPFLKTVHWILKLREEKFDLIVDLRNTAIPFLISAKFRTPLSFSSPQKIHMKQKHLNRLRGVWYFSDDAEHRLALQTTDDDRRFIDRLIQNHVGMNERFAIVAPGAASHIKRWKGEGFARVSEYLIEAHKIKVVLVGDKNDEDFVQSVIKPMKHKILNLCGQTALTQLAELIKRSCLVLANDSAVMHMASYLDVPVVAIFGPTDPIKYGPWSHSRQVVKSHVLCRACEKPNDHLSHECMDFIEASDAIKAVKEALKDSLV